MVHHTATGLHSLSAAWYGSHETPESGKSSTLWCWVHSSSRAGVSFGPLQRLGGDHSRGYHSHQDTYSVSICLELCFAPAGHHMQMPATDHLISRTSELILHGLLREDLGLTRRLWVSLWKQSDFVNPGIWAAFLCVHHWLLLHTCGIYPHDLQNTWLATTSNDKLGQEEDKIALPFSGGGALGSAFSFLSSGRSASLDASSWSSSGYSAR